MGEDRLNTKACRRCAECIGQKHHFLPLAEEDTNSGDFYYPCKHCDARLGVDEAEAIEEEDELEADLAREQTKGGG